MKKFSIRLISIIMCLGLVCSLCSCGNSDIQGKYIASQKIMGNIYIRTLVLESGGKGTHKLGTYSAEAITWKLSNDKLTYEYDDGDSVELIYDKDSNTLSSEDGSLVFHKGEE